MRQYLDKQDTIDQIRLDSYHPSNRHSVWILVEGEDDQSLYRKLTDWHDTKIELVYCKNESGELNKGSINQLCDAMRALADVSCVLGIRDADFLHLNQDKQQIDRLFLTDGHDREMLLLASDEALFQTLSSFITINSQEVPSIRTMLLGSIKFLAGLRWLNDEENLALNFKGFTLQPCYNVATNTLDVAGCLTQVDRQSPNQKRLPSADEVTKKIADIHDLFNLCNGHDAIQAFKLYINHQRSTSPHKTHKTGINDHELSRALQAAYRWGDFRLTQLCNLLLDWAQNNNRILFNPKFQV